PLTEAFKQICADDMGKSALTESLKQIKIQNTDTAISARSKDFIAFQDGVLTVNHKLTNYSNEADTDDRTKAIVKTLENGL
ncbi:MAG: hypothetical protein HRT45_13835, partial [Bdellovibrionales bacterium]|nr:hypothetical protein [Bdellovibrionales bacterium]